MEPDSKKRNNKVIGNYGEEIAANYLIKQGFVILSRNYLKKWGEKIGRASCRERV